MEVFCTPADAILGLDTEQEVLIADDACCSEWFRAVSAVALQYQMPYLDTRTALVRFYRSQRIISLYGVCKAALLGGGAVKAHLLNFYLAESAR